MAYHVSNYSLFCPSVNSDLKIEIKHKVSGTELVPVFRQGNTYSVQHNIERYSEPLG